MDAIGTWTLSEAQETDGVDDYNVYTATVGGETVTLKVDTDIQQASLYGNSSNNINLADLDGSNGFLIVGEDAGEQFGISVSDAGDVNGDGFDDIIVGASIAGNSGAAYVIFGKASGFSLVEDINAVATGDGTSGFQLLGENNGDQAGIAVSGAGDVNGDGFADVIVGAQTATGTASNTGAAYIVFGAASFTNAYALSALSSNGDGFTIDGTVANEGFGASVAAAGDIDGDGFDDVIIGAPGNSSQAGRAYILYGSGALGSDVSAAALGTEINGIDSQDDAGYRVDGVGDINDDGRDDVLITARHADGLVNSGANNGEAYVLFGQDGGLSATVTLGDLQSGDGSLGFTITSSVAGVQLGSSAGGIGDINGDGFADFAVSATLDSPDGITNAGSVFVIYGSGNSFAATLDVQALDSGDGSTGFRLKGSEIAGGIGVEISGAGDVNGDGFDDMLIDNRYSEPVGGTNTGGVYLVFGGNDNFGSDFTLAAMNGDEGVVLYGVDDNDQVGRALSSAGDLNGDGFDDILIGAQDADGLTNTATNTGEAYVVFGRDFTLSVDSIGSNGADVLIGSSGDDTLTGLGGADVIHAGAGNDQVIITDNLFKHLDGGGGQDTLFLDGAFNVDLTALASSAITGFEEIDMNNGLANILDIDFASVLDIGNAIDALVGENNLLVVSRDELDDTINLIGQWTPRAMQPTEATIAGYTVYDSDDSEASVAIQGVINQNIA